MKIQVNDGEVAAVDSSLEPKREKKRPVDGEAESGVVRIKLPIGVGVKAKEIVAELRERGAQVTLDELLSKYVEAIPDRYFEEQLLQRTPEPYYLEAAAKVPELREMLIRHAKKGLLRVLVQDTASGEPRRGRRKSVSTEAGTPQNSIVSVAG